MSRVYAAELDAFGTTFGSQQHGLPMSDARRLVEKYAPPGWSAVRGNSRGFGSWCPTDGTTVIRLGKYAGRPVVLHEIAHARTPHDRGHGQAFQLEYLRLVEQVMGRWWAGRLARCLSRHAPRGSVGAVREWRAGRAVVSVAGG